MNNLISDSLTSKNVTILYVDDEQVNLFLFQRNFEEDYPVLVASSGAEALEILEEKHDTVLVVISDFMMPGMNGVEFIKKAQNEYANIIYFMLTGYCKNKEIVNALEKKIIYECFSKPININKVELKIKEALTNLS